MIRSGGWSDWFSESGRLGARGGLFLLTLSVLFSIPLRAGSSDDFAPLFAGSSLEHYLGDIDSWSYQDGHLVAKTDSPRAESVFLLRQERFGNFILKFHARSDGATMNVLFRSADLPPGQLLGFEMRVGGENWGSLAFRKFGRPSQQPAKGEAGHAAPGFPDAVAMPFLRNAEEVELVHFDSSNSRVTFPRGQWVECEIDGLGNHIMVKVNGTTTASFRVDDSFYEKALGSRLPPGMAGKNAPFYEGMIGFQLPPATAGKVELKDIQIKTLGDINWVEGGSAERASNRSNESWKASAPAFKRATDEEWSRETHDLLNIARREEGFRSIFDGKSLQGWSNSAAFWTAKDGFIVGQPRNAFLVTDREYADFILTGSVHLSPPGSNSGIQFRSAVIPDGMRGYQFDMGIPWWGHLYVESTMRGIVVPVDDRMKRVKLIHPDGRNEVVIVCKGNHVIGELNGVVTYDLVDYYGDRTGLIGLQIHAGAPMEVKFKDLKIKELN
jgi:hypothetical protein